MDWERPMTGEQVFETQGNFAERVRDSVGRQTVLSTMGVRLVSVAPGRVALEMPFHSDFTQQHGFLHAGIVTTALDSAAGYAAYSLMPERASVLTIELKTSLMRPARGALFRFEGRVLKPGRTVMFTEASAYADDVEIAHLTASMMVVQGREGVEG